MTFAWETQPTFETERLILRPITFADKNDWQAIFIHPDVMCYLPEFENEALVAAQISGIVQWTHDIFSQQTGMRWAITLKSDNKMIGSCGYHLLKEEHRCSEIGYELHPDYWRQGIMSEALTVMLNFGWIDLELHRIEANVTVGNEASAGILTSFGFTKEGTWRDKVYGRGQFFSLWQFGLLEDEVS